MSKVAYEMMEAIPRDEDGCPLTLEGAIRSMILKSPDSICYRDDALNTMYCVLGSGIGWSKDGRITDLQPNNYMNMPPDSYSSFVWCRDHGVSETLDQLGANSDVAERIREELVEKPLRRAVETVKDIDNRCISYNPVRDSFYPVSLYHTNLAAPENAQHDFLAGAVETCCLLKLYQPDFGDRNYRHYIRSRSIAEEFLPVLTERLKNAEPAGIPAT